MSALSPSAQADRGAVRVVVDWSLCESNGLCADVAPHVFRLDDDDDLHVLVDEVPADELPQVSLAVRRCPRQALTITS